MKEIKIFILIAFTAFSAQAQIFTSLNQNFNSSFCPGEGKNNYPGSWQEQNFLPLADSLAWHCTPANGENGTGGMYCSGFYNSANHSDTAYLITPQLDIQSYSGNVYMQFDTKTDNFNSGALLGFMPSHDSILNNADTMLPPSNPLSAADQAGWVTHQVDITYYKSFSTFYFAFRYTSTIPIESIWYLDNVLITGTPLDVSNVSKGTIPITIIGWSTPDQIKISYKTSENGIYDLSIYDLLGREVYKQSLNVQSSNSNYTIAGLNLHNGMYILKISNGTTYGIAKTIIQ